MSPPMFLAEAAFGKNCSWEKLPQIGPLLYCLTSMSKRLRTNMAKSSCTHIYCMEEDLEVISNELSYGVKNFPCSYLRLLLTIRKPSKTDFLPLVDKMANSLLGWKASLMNRAGWLITVRMVLSATPIYAMMVLDLPKWVPMKALVLLNLEKMGWALPMRWLWLQKTDFARAWAGLSINVPQNIHSLSNVAVKTIVGNGENTKFWKDRWLQGKTVAEMAPNLFNLISKRARQQHIGEQALENRKWVAGIHGGLSEQDQHVWKLTTDGKYNCKSTYEAYFLGSIKSDSWKHIGRAGLLYAVSSSFGWPSTVGDGQPTGLQSEDCSTQRHVPFVIKVKKLSNTF
uniref:Reverse transcriptase zinc-binding domain-containing protein n=1 Tax=Oryza brachyantha TaxID=4533 RepID=J3M704_ORYBR